MHPIVLTAAESLLDRVLRWAWAKMPWSKDTKKRTLVRERFGKLLVDAEAAVEKTPVEQLGPKLDRLLEGLRGDLLAAGIPSGDAEELTARAHLVLDRLASGTFEQSIGFRAKVAELERQVAQTQSEIHDLRARLGHTLAEQERATRLNRVLIVAVAVALFLAIWAFLRS